MIKKLMRALVVLCIVIPSSASAEQAPVLFWSGMEWEIKASSKPMAPGPNYYSRSRDSVFVDGEELHMLIRSRNDRWFCSEIKSVDTVGYGTYRVSLETPLEDFPPQAVFGFFTWSDTPDLYHREIDIEISAWNSGAMPSGQFTIQPHTDPDKNHSFSLPPGTANLSLSFTRTPESTHFSVFDTGKNRLVSEWRYNGGLPPADEHLHFNLWLYRGLTDNLSGDTEVILKDFEYIPYKKEGHSD